MWKSIDWGSPGPKGYVDVSLDSNTFPYLSPEFQKAEMASLIERLYLKQKQKPVSANREQAALEEAQAHLVKTLVGNEVVLDKTFADAVEKMKERKPAQGHKFTVFLTHIDVAIIIQKIYYELPHKEEWLETVISSLNAKFSIKLEEIMEKELPKEDSEESKKLIMISAIFYYGVVCLLGDGNFNVNGVNISKTIRQETDLVPFLCKLFKETNVVQEVLQKMHPNGVVETFNTKYVPLIYDKVKPFAYSLSKMPDFRDRAVYESLYMFYTGQRDSIHADMIDVIDNNMTKSKDNLLHSASNKILSTTLEINYDEIRKAFEANYGKQSIRKAVTTNLNMRYEHVGDFQGNEKDERITRLLVNVFQDLFDTNKIEKRKETFCRLLEQFADSYFIRDIIWIIHRHSTQLPEDVKTYEYGRKLNSPVLFKLNLNPDQPFRHCCTQVDEEDTGISMVLKTVNAMVCPRQFSISVADMKKICTSFMNDELSYQDYLLLGASVKVVRVKVTTRI